MAHVAVCLFEEMFGSFLEGTPGWVVFRTGRVTLPQIGALHCQAPGTSASTQGAGGCQGRHSISWTPFFGVGATMRLAQKDDKKDNHRFGSFGSLYLTRALQKLQWVCEAGVVVLHFGAASKILKSLRLGQVGEVSLLC